MLEILQYVTSGFWVFVGSAWLLTVVPLCLGWGINAALLGVRGKKCNDVNLGG